MNAFLHYLANCFIAVLLLFGATSAAANLRVHDVVMAELVSTPLDAAGEPVAIVLQLSAMGRDIQLQLKPSRLNRIGKLQGMDNIALPYLYEGYVQGDANSWARISVKDGQPTGHFFHYGTLFQLENRTHLRGLITTTASDSDYILIEPASANNAAPLLQSLGMAFDKEHFAPNYELSDNPAYHNNDEPNTGRAIDALSQKKLSGTNTSVITSNAKPANFSAANFASTGTASRFVSNRNALGTTVTRALRVGIVVDSRFNETHQNRGLARALSIMNSVDAIYQSQLGVALVVEGIRVYDDPATDPMRDNSGSVEKILTNFRPIRNTDERLPNDLTLVHLFTGHRDPERVIGLGWISTACRLDGFDLSMSTPFPFDSLLAAHEIAHNLGALHDDNPQCLSETTERPNTLMWPELSGSSTADFSLCSTRDMQASINASCNLNNIDVGIRLRTFPSSEFLRRSVVIDVVNQDTLRRATEVISITKFPIGTSISDLSAGCVTNQNEVTCNHGTLQAQSIHSMSMSATLIDRSRETVESKIELLNATDVSANDNRAVIQLLTFDESTGEAVAAESTTFADGEIFQPNDAVSGLGIGSASAASLAALLLFLSKNWRIALRRRYFRKHL